MMQKKKIIKWAFFILIGFFCLGVLAIAIPNIAVYASADARILTFDEIKGEDYDCILVLGAGLKDKETPSDMLRDRLEIGVCLYKSGFSDRLLMSGDHMYANYNEVAVMKQYAIDAGIASETIFLDHAGISTYDSVYRAKEIFGAKKILIVTQEYHLYRALYIAEALGLEAYGISADLNTYRGQWARDIRELAARTKDFLLCIVKSEPKYLGASIDLSGDGNVTN